MQQKRSITHAVVMLGGTRLDYPKELAETEWVNSLKMTSWNVFKYNEELRPKRNNLPFVQTYLSLLCQAK